MPYTVSRKDIARDYYLLFGLNTWNPIGLLKKLPPSELKAAYRKKALETHPDRAKSLGKVTSEMDKRFRKITIAYERLSSYIQGNHVSVLTCKSPTRKNSNKTTAIQKTKRKASDHFCKGYIPKRKLLIGQYLYYSGTISWRTLFQAIVWQRKQRPLIGQIALDWGILSANDIKEILTGRSHKEYFGEYARRKGYITPFEFLALIGKQHKLQLPIGEYFIKQGILSAKGMDRMIERLRIHNIDVFK
ncbi:MAG: J domain-containing protein [Planctomycetota bacterium]|jgi:hypothetical protein